MRYFKNETSSEVFGYDATQSDLIDAVVSDSNFVEITGSWPLPEPEQPFSLYKTTIYERMTDAELSTFDTAMQAAPLRERLVWRDCVTVNSDSPHFGQLQAAMQAAFGTERTAIILARP